MFVTTALDSAAGRYVNELVSPATNGTVLDADDRNITQDEIVNSILSSSQSLDPTGADDEQLARAITIVGASAGFCLDSGAVNAYAVAPFNSTAVQPNAYSQMDGFAVQFVAGAVNTGASTLNFNGLGVKPLVKATTAPLTGGEVFSTCTALFVVSIDSFIVLFSAGTSTTGVQSITAGTGLTVGGTVSIPNIVLDALPVLHATNGYSTAHDGTITMWGELAAPAGDSNYTLTFPVYNGGTAGFPTACLNVIPGTLNPYTGNDDVIARVISFNQTQVVLRADATGGVSGTNRKLTYKATGY